MIDPKQLEEWTVMARRDDWHLMFVSSDIRQMLGEIGRLRGIVDQVRAVCDDNKGPVANSALAVKFIGEVLDRA